MKDKDIEREILQELKMQINEYLEGNMEYELLMTLIRLIPSRIAAAKMSNLIFNEENDEV